MAETCTGLDWTLAEAPTRERLVAKLMSSPDACVKKVLTAKEVTRLQEADQVVPAVYLVYMGFGVASADGEGALRVTYRHKWIVSVAVQSAAAQTDPQLLHAAAAPIAARVAAALHGWAPAKGWAAFEPVTPPPVAYSDLGYCYVPQAFVSTTVGRSIVGRPG
ncbi:phage tail terminator protein [Ideonella sp.]|uniref:phage tail terminator protein n=1 Tax=Ideonella sp. TaxID=1929293 RepID=UPI003BB5D316